LISSTVFSLPRESLIDPWAISGETPIAKSTWEGSGSPVVQADPEEAKPYDLKASTTAFVDQEWIPLDTVTFNERMEEFLNKHIS